MYICVFNNPLYIYDPMIPIDEHQHYIYVCTI